MRYRVFIPLDVQHQWQRVLRNRSYFLGRLLYGDRRWLFHVSQDCASARMLNEAVSGQDRRERFRIPKIFQLLS